MHADLTPPPASAPLLTRGTIALLALLVALPTLLGAGLWSYAAEHQVVPGLTGCRFVRERAPQIDCYSSELRELVRDNGLKATLAQVDQVALEQPTLAADCHLALHPIGERAGARAARTASAYTNITPTSICQEGYFHGYSIGYLTAAPAGTLNVRQLVADQCSIAEDARAVLNCVHSFGHVITRREGDDLAAATAQCASPRYRALPFASSMTGGAEAYRFQCYYGLFMEVSLIDLKEGSAVLDNCADAPGGRVARRACYAYLSARVGAMRNGLADGARACHDLAPAGEMRESCITTFGQGLPDVKHCDLFTVEAERRLCTANVGAEAIT